MLGRLPSLTIVRLLAALLLATIGLQAGASFEATPLPTHGSAFSAETYEVALAPQRRAVAAALTAATPLLPQAPILFAAAPLRLAALSAQPAPRPDSTGPPARPVLTRPAAPRAPPPA